MRDCTTFIVLPGTKSLPAGNFAGYIDLEPSYIEDKRLPFPHILTVQKLARCVLRIERADHPEIFSSADPYNCRDIDVTSLVVDGVIAHDQHLVPDALAREAA